MDHSDRSNNRCSSWTLLRALVAVADCGSFTSAAGRLSSTQSTVSQKVRRLEELGRAPVAGRGNRDVLPTDCR